MSGRRAQKLIAAVYSATAARVYEPLVVHGGFRVFGGRLNELVAEQGRRAVEVAEGGPILDMPVGTAYFTRTVARLHPGVIVGVDLAKGMVEESARVAGREGLSNLTVVQADAHELPFEDGTFKAILCTNGLQVMPGLEGAVAELARVLAPGGTLFVSVVGLPLRSRSLPTALATRNVTDAILGAGLRIAREEQARLATGWEATQGL